MLFARTFLAIIVARRSAAAQLNSCCVISCRDGSTRRCCCWWCFVSVSIYDTHARGGRTDRQAESKHQPCARSDLDSAAQQQLCVNEPTNRKKRRVVYAQTYIHVTCVCVYVCEHRLVCIHRAFGYEKNNRAPMRNAQQQRSGARSSECVVMTVKMTMMVLMMSTVCADRSRLGTRNIWHMGMQSNYSQLVDRFYLMSNIHTNTRTHTWIRVYE